MDADINRFICFLESIKSILEVRGTFLNSKYYIINIGSYTYRMDSNKIDFRNSNYTNLKAIHNEFIKTFPFSSADKKDVVNNKFVNALSSIRRDKLRKILY